MKKSLLTAYLKNLKKEEKKKKPVQKVELGELKFK